MEANGPRAEATWVGREPHGCGLHLAISEIREPRPFRNDLIRGHRALFIARPERCVVPFTWHETGPLAVPDHGEDLYLGITLRMAVLTTGS